jgi:hypothetical protein
MQANLLLVLLLHARGSVVTHYTVYSISISDFSVSTPWPWGSLQNTLRWQLDRLDGLGFGFESDQFDSVRLSDHGFGQVGSDRVSGSFRFQIVSGWVGSIIGSSSVG